MPESPTPSLRREIAAVAARLVADSGLDYASAKRKAARQILGRESDARGRMPDNDEVDAALLEHLTLFDDEHDARVARRRRAAVSLMMLLEPFAPYLTGGVWKGIVAEHAPIHVQVFHDNAKEVEIALLDARVAFEVGELPHLGGVGEVEALGFDWRGEPVIVSLYETDAVRAGQRTRGGVPERGDLAAVRRLLGPA